MISHLEPGVYVVAVSGGVDSMVLLHILAQRPDLKLVVAHLDHGIRHDSALDRRLVQNTAAQLGVPSVFNEARLGKDASEATARTARYEFLQKTRRAANAKAIITAHHQDDMLETALLNMVRGSGRKGLTALDNRPKVLRPLLAVSKSQLITYAHHYNIVWREDSTNSDTTYTRNYVRHKIMPRLTPAKRQKLLDVLQKLRTQNTQIDSEISALLEDQKNAINRNWFTGLPHDVATEIMATWLRQNGLRQIDRPLIERLTIVSKTAANNTTHDIYGGARMHVSKAHLALR